MNRTELTRKIRRSLRTQGFRLTATRVLPPENLDKATIRNLHATAVRHKLEQSARALRSHEDALLGFIANGSHLDPLLASPVLIPVESGSTEELLFRYATMHWTVPVSSGYGRRLRFVVMDRSNGKLMGVIGLCDPVIALGCRDQWIGWSEPQRLANLRHVMDAFVLGAVPPYSHLLFGKLIALLCASDEVRKALYRKYHGARSLISGKPFDGRIALITTMSALGRSSVYNRLHLNGEKVFRSVGFSRGTGEFHFSNGLYSSISKYAKRYCEPTYRKRAWGEGFRNRREVIRKCLRKLHLNVAWSYHGIERECFVIPLAANTREFLRHEETRLRWSTHTVDEVFSHFKSRWLLPRLSWDERYASFAAAEYRLWSA